MHNLGSAVQRGGVLAGVCLSMMLATAWSSMSIAGDDNSQSAPSVPIAVSRERLLIDDDWQFIKGDPPDCNVSLLYDVRPQRAAGRGPAAESAPAAESPPPAIVKSWILPSGNDFLNDSGKAAKRPDSNLGEGVAYIAPDFDDSSWRSVD